MKQFISWAIIKRVTESKSILIKRGIEAHFRARLQPYSKCNTFEVISNLLNSDNLKVAITQLCHELQV